MWVQFVVTLIISLAMSYLNRPKFRNAKPAGLDEIKVPTAEAGREIPVLFGTRNIKSSNVVWYGNFSVQPITQKVASSTLFSSAKYATVGYKYFLGIHFVLTHGPADKITKIEFDNKTAWTGNVTSGSFTVSAPSLFGGDDSEGGVSGGVDFLPGSFTQSQNAYLQSVLGTNDIPAFRGVTSVVFKSFYVGNSPYIKTPTFWVTRTPKGWNEANAAIGIDANPIHIIYECLTNKDWGLGYSTADIDNTSFTAAAATMVSESLGISLLWDRSKGINEFISDILSHIDGTLYVDRATGLFKMKLSRNDYNVNTIPLLNESNVIKIVQFKRQSIAELKSSVSVVYYDNTVGEQNSVTVQDTALASQQGGPVRGTNQYPGIGNATLAAKIAARDLQALSTPLASCTIITDRTLTNLNVGDVFALTWPKYGITANVFRVGEIDFGTMNNNEITIKAVQDVFSYSTVTYSATGTSAWVNPVSQPQNVTDFVLVEPPYGERIASEGSVTSTENYFAIAATPPTPDSLRADLYTFDGANYVQAGSPLSFCPYATISAEYKPNVTTMAITAPSNIEIVRPGSYALIRSSGNFNNINDELVSVTSVSSTSITVGRGVLDTTPVKVAANSRIYFLSDYWASDGQNYATSSTASIKLLTNTGIGVLSLASATIRSITMANRVNKPYPPGRLRINTLAYPDSIIGTSGMSPPGDFITFSWAHRDRITQGASLTNTEATSIGPESGVTYDVTLYRNSTIVNTSVGLSATTVTYNVTVDGTYTVLIYAKRSGILSHTPLFWTFQFTTADTLASNLELESGENMLQEDNTFILLEE